ncbi:MAG: DUF1501 domain-containing protein [Acidimicrobiales bacterium]
MTSPISRRLFLQGATAVTASMAFAACRDEPDAAPNETTTTRPTPTADGTLVVVTLAGGNDALNTVCPVDDPIYRAQRGALALDPATTLALSEGFALHPALVCTKALWDADRLAVVHGVGFDGLDRSHFHCMDVWQAADTHDLTTGWIGRWLDLASADPLDAVAVGRGLPLLVRGAERSAAVLPAGPFVLPGDADLRARFADQSAADPARPALQTSVARSSIDLLAVADAVGPVVAAAPADDTFAARLQTVAALIEADLPTRAFAVELGGFDTHAAQAATHDALLGELDAALGTFLDQVDGRRVTVVVYSEFGRRVAANGSGGTDHGSAGTVLVAGTVRPGHHGEPSPLDALVDGDLATIVDFRSVYGGLLEDVLGIDAGDVLGDAPAPLHLV